MNGSIFEVEHHADGGMVLRVKAPKSWRLPPDVQQHLFGAQKEMLLMLRSILDRGIDVAEEFEKPKQRKKTKIKVD